MREDEIVSDQLRAKAHVLTNGEVCWSGDDIEAAPAEIAAAGNVILDFDFLELLPQGEICQWGTSAYSIDALKSKPWKECVALAYELAIKDVRDTQRLTGREPPYSDLWYCVVTVDQLGARTLEGGVIFVREAKQDEKRRKRSHLRPCKRIAAADRCAGRDAANPRRCCAPIVEVWQPPDPFRFQEAEPRT